MGKARFEFDTIPRYKHLRNVRRIEYIARATVSDAEFSILKKLIDENKMREAHNLINEKIENRKALNIRISKGLLRLENVLWEIEINDGNKIIVQ